MKVTSAPASWRVDPYRVTDFARNQGDREAFMLFCAAVANKKATVIADKIHAFLDTSGHAGTPFERVRAMVAEGSLDDAMRHVRLGKYALLGACYAALVRDPALDLRTVTAAQLEALPGFGPKTARFFVLHSVANARCAVIDTHVLKMLRDMGAERIPKGFPTAREYPHLEVLVLAEADRLGLTPQDFDLKVWTWYSRRNQGLPDFMVASAQVDTSQVLV